jgi:hypothetical protein
MRPFSITEIFCRLGLNVRLVARKENERLCPKVVALPQVLHLAMIYVLSILIPGACLARFKVPRFFSKARDFTI